MCAPTHKHAHTQTLTHTHKHTHTHTHTHACMHSHTIWGPLADGAKTGYCHANFWIDYICICMEERKCVYVCIGLCVYTCMYAHRCVTGYVSLCAWVTCTPASFLPGRSLSFVYTFSIKITCINLNSVLFFSVWLCCCFCVQEREQEEEEAIAQSDEPVVSAASTVCGVLNLNTAWICCGSLWMFKGCLFYCNICCMF